MNNDNNLSPLGPNDVDDGQYREDPSIYYKDDKYNTEPVKINSQPSRFQLNSFENGFSANQQRTENYKQFQPQTFQPQSRFQSEFQQPKFQAQSFQQQSQLQPQTFQQPQYQQQSFEPRQYQQQQQQQSYFPSSQADLFKGHPATQFDINTGSYSVSYTG